MKSSILSKIKKIRKRKSKTVSNQKAEKYLLNEYRIEYDYLERKVYVNAQVHPNSLDKGTDISEEEKKLFLRYYGNRFVDHAVQVIDKKLGGTDYIPNYISLNVLLDMTAWKMAEEEAYNHVKKGGMRYAQINFAFQYDNKNGEYMSRPVKIYYYYALYEDNIIFGEPMEGIIENINPEKESIIQSHPFIGPGDDRLLIYYYAFGDAHFFLANQI